MKPQVIKSTHQPVIETLLRLDTHFEELNGHIYVYDEPSKLNRIKGILHRRHGITCVKKSLGRLIFNLK